jgi:uncharacterized membrane protein
MTHCIMAKSKHSLQCILAAILTLSLSACGIYETKSASANSPRTNLQIDPRAKISFAQVSDQIFRYSGGAQTCKTCHTDGGARNGVKLDSYLDVIHNLSAVEATVFNADPVQMPPRAALSDDQKKLLRQWIDQGALEFAEPTPEPTVTPEPTATPVPTATPEPTATPIAATLVPTYQSIRDLVFVQKCLLCHAPGGRASDLPLDTYATMIAAGSDLLVPGDVASSKIVSQIQAGKMPTARSGLPKVTADELAVIKIWITNGAPQ